MLQTSDTPTPEESAFQGHLICDELLSLLRKLSSISAGLSYDDELIRCAEMIGIVHDIEDSFQPDVLHDLGLDNLP